MKMDKEKENPKRKALRLTNYDYNTAGAYFVTICTQDRKRILSEVLKPQIAPIDEFQILDTVGDGALDVPLNALYEITKIRLTSTGRIIEKYLLSSENIPGVKIDRYVIMPDHIHAIIFLDPNKYASRKCDTSKPNINGTSKAPSPTINKMLPHVISTFKRFCNKEIGHNIFQRSYIEHIIRDKADYDTRIKYIFENPLRWYYKHLYKEEQNI